MVGGSHGGKEREAGMKVLMIVSATVMAFASSFAREEKMRRVEWEKLKIDDGAFESAGILDVNNDGKPDIVCGGFWYEAPHWKKHKICDVEAHGEYLDDFSTIPMDVNGDGYLDVITGGWFGQTLIWRENPKGQPVEWKTHPIDKCGNIETARAWDIDGDGFPEIVPNTPRHPLVFYKLIRDDEGRGTGEFRKVQVSDKPQGHGLGFGEIAGKRALIVSKGWWEAPDNPLDEPWTFHNEFNLGHCSMPIIAVDFNGDGLTELIVGQAHGYGLDYYQQRVDKSGRRVWIKHPIDPYFSQYHEMKWVDIDGDGQGELITGNRYRAHCGRDPGETDVVGLYCFKWNGESFTKQVIDHGKAGEASGTGISLAIDDLDGDGRLDIVAPGKEGLFIFRNLGPESAGKK